MLQYPVPLPPLSLSSSRKYKGRSGTRPNDASSPSAPTRPLPSPINNPRRTMHGPSSIPSAFAVLSHPHAIPISPINVSSFSPPPSRSSASPVYTSSPVSFPASSSSNPWGQPVHPSENASSTRRSSMASSLIGDVLSQGDLVGEDLPLQGEPIRLVSTAPTVDSEAPAKEFEVVRRLGTGSYAVVYLVKEVLSRPVPSMDGHISLDGMELDDKIISRPSIEYGREFAIKCLSKANLDGEALAAQKAEVTIHQSLRPHDNIATLHRTLETSSFLLLLLEFVPGEDLYYFLEQARDHYDTDSPASEQAISSSRTPPTPSLLSNLHPSQLLSRNRLRLIASMFSQMCEAVAACHDQQVFHRDIKPENFIVTDGWTTLSDGRRERRVVVKLTDFGLSTTDLDSSDMDCGSAPYMSYECRNNVAPTYKPRAADVWSLGIVLINMLYHFNPWQDTAQGTCNSFDVYRQQPVNFFMQRFTGMTLPVAEYLANKVFCVLEDPQDDSRRVGAREFGTWIKELPTLLGDTSASGHKRAVSISSTQGFPIAQSVPTSRRPSSRQASNTMYGLAPDSRSRSRAPSLGPAYEMDGSELPTVFDQDSEEQYEESTYSRSTSTTKRRKRGARKGKGSAAPFASPRNLGSPTDDTLETLATASQSLAREISKASRSSSKHRNDLPLESSSQPPPVPVVTKKTSKWKLSFGKNSSSGEKPVASPVEEVPLSETNRPTAMSSTASNVTNLIMGLNAPALTSTGISQSKTADTDQMSSWGRGRRPKNSAISPPAKARQSSPPMMWDHSGFAPQPYNKDRATSPRGKSPRALSPSSTLSGRPVASSASSMASSNWRSSTSSAISSSSAFTSYSNNSSRSVSTQATSVSASSWRTQGTTPSKPKNAHSQVSLYGDPAQQIPKNVKFMSGVPWELHQLPRQMHPNPVGDIFGSPPPRNKQRVRKPKDQLDTIAERCGMSPKPAGPVSESQETVENHSDQEEEVIEEEEGQAKKVVQKGQINALAKMLSALRR